jgi:HSP20 family protein
MAIVKWDPFSQLNNLHEQVNSLFNDSFGGMFNGRSSLMAPTDVYSTDEGLTIEAHLPNFKDEDITVEESDGSIVIRAEHSEREESDDKDKKYLVRESVSQYYRRFALPKNSDTENIKAKLSDGKLKVTVPYKELPEPKKIEIEK